ncbi:hypothetical protein [Nitrososphaera sp.]|uniref:hypothetical protein n=1 Tax=Nitrososphaera sp. TaxID=1971748 RepID=UPI00307D977F
MSEPRSQPRTVEDVVRRFFKLIDSKDLAGLLDLFEYDATVREPFSRSEVLRGRSEIEPFLKVVLMANSDMRRRIQLDPHQLREGHRNGGGSGDDDGDEDSKATATVTFEKGDKVRGRFAFVLNPHSKKIRSLTIQF